MGEDSELVWRKSSFSASSDCVEWALAPGGQFVLVRDSKQPDGPRLCYSLSEWNAFLGGAKAGEADI